MWSSQSGGGFMNNQASPATQGAGSGGKEKRAKNVVPVMIEEVLNAPEEGFTIEGVEVGMVSILGKIVEIERAVTKNTYKIEDSTGTLDVIQWLVEDSPSVPEYTESQFVSIVGSIRTQGEKKHMMAFGILEAPTQEQKDFHALQVVYSHLKLKQLNLKMTGQAGMMDNSGLSNSMMGGGLGSTMGASTTSASFGNKNHDMVYALIKGCIDENGINLDTILTQVRGKMSKGEMDGAIDFLSGEGHIYSTIDDEHYKTTDGD